MEDPLSVEFDTVAGWTAEVLADRDHGDALAAGARGSGGPALWDELLAGLRAEPGSLLLDCGGGMGAPAAHARDHGGLQVVLTDPEPEACRAARDLFDLSAVRAGTRLPFRDQTFDLAWCLGVLCTVDDQPLLLAELGRVVRAGGRLALLVYVWSGPTDDRTSEQPEGNDFPASTGLTTMVNGAGFVVERQWDDVDASPPEAWRRRSESVDDIVRRRHEHDPRWQVAQDQQDRMSALVGSGRVRPVAMIVTRASG